MPRPLPPLNSLRAFEAAARHLSFTRAAEELNVTQAAVSHQVKALEERIGVKLFRRLTRGLLLTEDGHALLPDLREAFDRLAQAVDRVGRQAGQGTLNISLLTTFALGWLVPRLPRFQAAHPSIDVRLTTTARLIDFAVEDVDVAVRYGTGGWAGLRCDKILDDVITPLCNARFKERLRKPEDILSVPLLHEQYEHDWRTWFRAAGLSVGQLKKGPIFDSTRVAVEAAIAGIGVACGAPTLFSAELASGQLHQPFDIVVPNGKSYWLVSPEATSERPKIKAFREWILAEAALPTPAPETTHADRRSDRAAAAGRKSAKASRAPDRDGGSRD
ncbi:MAG TPA: transcriptional regulator GcvA [Alphaproteobacteria bacterium]|nr:transcriptional regulator GcvA [Alphaproteobacteria bacterium]